jgi:tetratricopeptide (TPR) repeat protein
MNRGQWLAASALVLAGCASSRPVAPPALLSGEPPVFPSEPGELTREPPSSDATSEVPRLLRDFVKRGAAAAPVRAESWLLDVSGRVPTTTDEIAGVRLAARRVRVRLEQGFARTLIEEELVNESANELEGKLVFRVPPRAVLGQMALWVEGQPIEAAVVESRRARAVYGEIVDVARRDPALVERQPGGRVTLRVFPIPARQSRRVSYAYDEPLVETATGLRYRLPLVLPAWAPALDELSLEVEVIDPSETPVATSDEALRSERRAGRTSLRHRAQAVRPADLLVTLLSGRAPALAVSAERAGGRVAALRITHAPATAAPPPSVLAIVVDTSAGQRGTAFDQSIRLAAELVAGLEQRQRFVLLGCDGACAAYPASGLALASADHIEAARAFLLTLVPAGASDLDGALTQARARLDAEARSQLVVFSDMQMSTGAFVGDRALPAVRGLDLRLIGVGAGVEVGRLSRLATELGAARLLLENGDTLSVERLRQWLAAPAALPSLTLPAGLSEMVPPLLPLAVAGDSEMVLARVGAGFHAAHSSHGFEGPGRLWASERITALELAAGGATPASVELARRYGVLSEQVALLALDTAPAFRRFGITRHSSRPPTVRMAGTRVSGRLPPAAIQRTVREHFGRFRACYHQGLLRNPELAGSLLTRFVIARDGSVQSPESDNGLGDVNVARCIERAFTDLRFSAPEGGVVTVVYPLRFSPARSEAAPRPLPSPARRWSVPRFRPPERPPAPFEIVSPSELERTEADTDERTWLDEARARVAQAPRDARFRRQLIRAFLATGHFVEAEAAADRFVGEFPVSLEALESAADAKHAVRDVAGAAAALAAAVELDPLAVQRQRRAATAYVMAGDERRACAHFRAASVLAPSDRRLEFEAFRCRAATGSGRLELLAELDAAGALTPELEQLRSALTEQRALPSFPPAAHSGFSVQIICSTPNACPTPLLVSEDGDVTVPTSAGAREASLHIAEPKGRMRLYFLGGTLQGARALLSSGETSQQVELAGIQAGRSIELRFSDPSAP